MGYRSINNKTFSIIFILILLLISGVCFVSLISSGESSKPAAVKLAKVKSTPSTKPKSTTTTTIASTTTTTTTTTTTKPKAKAQAEVTTTTIPSFSVEANASLADEDYDQCFYKRYVFAGSVSANKAGTATWTWIRWDGASTGTSGSVTFDADGNTSGSVDNYTLDLSPFSSTTGWAALKVEWSDGSDTSSHVNFTFTYPIPPANYQPHGC